ncbi:hypothetical protein [Pseudanabaena yagii]|uniref:Uncharacterized protein n=1 Tax=Pseudanabaena yagii GIHE-NHR1 TaxID=2722753 RepID=A0ABX1LWH8_9CYAN|nr:hypothetical protein [Pseudanabaena yagii]NMF60543.1 hypothetical protein [Pseudanabaena yagii GIHE-NHR1]
MFSKSKLFILSIFIVLFLCIASPVLAQESGGEGGNKQTPVQVIVQIVITAIALSILNKFDLP